MKRSVNVLGFVTCFLLSIGIMFKIMDWPTANIQLLLGFALLNFGLLPMLFFTRFRSAKV